MYEKGFVMSEKRNDINELVDPKALADSFASFRARVAAETCEEAPAAIVVEPKEPLQVPLSEAFAVRRLGPADVMGAFLASRVSPRTKATMRAALDRIGRLLGSPAEAIPWHELRFEHTDAIRAALLNEASGYGRATVLVTLAALKGILTQAFRMRLMTADDYANATLWDNPPPDGSLAGREVLQEEIEKIQAYIATERGAYGAYLETVFVLLLGTGLREIEAAHLARDAYNPDAQTIKVLRKGGKWAELPLGPNEVRALNEWIIIRETFERQIKSEALLLRVQRNNTVRPRSATITGQTLIDLCVRISKAAGVARFRPHDLRRTFCSRCLREKDTDVFIVQRLMGHSKPETTRRYDRRTDEEAAIKRRTWNIWRPPTSNEPEGSK
jgi:integrase/recombinase XerD